MTSAVVSNEMYVILGASGNTGSIIANSLLSAGSCPAKKSEARKYRN
jgi:hypothetical protein